MAPRAYWTGNVKISLVSFGVRLYNAVSEGEKIRLNQVHKDCNQRIKMPTTCPIHGQVERTDITKAYEFEKDKYVVIPQDELDKIKLRSEKTIELTRFVPADSVQDLYLDSSYFMAPDGPIAEEPFRVFRVALDETRAAGIGTLTIAGRERPILLRGAGGGGKGFTLSTLHAAAEVRQADQYFDDIKSDKPNPEYMQLATSLIKGKMGAFEPSLFRDRYQEALVELVKSKMAGQAPVIIHEEELPASFNFADALRQSLAGDGAAAAPAAAPVATPAQPRSGKKPPARSETAPAPAASATKKPARRKHA
jgi:DNA end-binding protein Ku